MGFAEIFSLTAKIKMVFQEMKAMRNVMQAHKVQLE